MDVSEQVSFYFFCDFSHGPVLLYLKMFLSPSWPCAFSYFSKYPHKFIFNSHDLNYILFLCVSLSNLSLLQTSIPLFNTL